MPPSLQTLRESLHLECEELPQQMRKYLGDLGQELESHRASGSDIKKLLRLARERISGLVQGQRQALRVILDQIPTYVRTNGAALNKETDDQKTDFFNRTSEELLLEFTQNLDVSADREVAIQIARICAEHAHKLKTLLEFTKFGHLWTEVDVSQQAEPIQNETPPDGSPAIDANHAPEDPAADGENVTDEPPHAVVNGDSGILSEMTEEDRQNVATMAPKKLLKRKEQ